LLYRANDLDDPRNLIQLQQVYAAVQEEIYALEGTINKFIMDDKGSTVIAAFGLPPLAHDNDATRAVLSSLAIHSRLGHDHKVDSAIGITTGVVFAGVCGHRGSRREYTVLGDTVNLSARLMQRC
jgi:class 3 adenylate cyclase